MPATRRAQRPLVFIIALAALLPFMGGCAFYSAPSLRLVSATKASETEDGLVVSFVVAARNDNDVDLPLREVEYALSLDGREVFDGARSAEATLRNQGEQVVVLPAVIPLAGEGRPRPTGVVPFRLRGRMTYTTPGALAETLFDTGVRRPEVGLDLRGLLDFGDAPGGPVELVLPVPAGAEGPDV